MIEMGRGDSNFETEALTGLSMFGPRKSSKFTALEKGLLASLAVAVIFICVLIGVIVLFSYTTLREERQIESDISDLLLLQQQQQQRDRDRLEGGGADDDALQHQNEFDSDMSDQDRENLEDILNEAMAQKTLEKERAFAKRYPRDQYRSSAAANSRRLIQSLPRPLRQVSDREIPLTPSEKIAEIMYSLDDDNDMSSDPWELHDWIQWVEKIFHQHTLEELWDGFGRNETIDTLNWSDFQVRCRCSSYTLFFLLT